MIKTTDARIVSALLLTTILSAPFSVHAQDDHPKTPLSEQMSGIAHDMRALRRMLSDPAQKEAALKLVKDMEDHATKAKGYDPAKAKDVPAADKDQFLADYRKQMDGLIADFQKLEADVTDGKTADASAMLDTLQSDKRAGHKKFTADDHNGPGGPGGPWGGPGGPGGQWGGPDGHRPPPDDGQAPPMQSGTNGALPPPPPQ